MTYKFKISNSLWFIYNTVDQSTQYFLFDISIVEKENVKGLQIVFLWFNFIIGC